MREGTNTSREQSAVRGDQHFPRTARDQPFPRTESLAGAGDSLLPPASVIPESRIPEPGLWDSADRDRKCAGALRGNRLRQSGGRASLSLAL
jgi:hypothetical protein